MAINTDHICRNCRWWNNDGRFTEPERPEVVGWCEHEHLLAHGCEDGGVIMPIATAHDFGCVQWEGKE